MWWLVPHKDGHVMLRRPEQTWRAVSFVVFDCAGRRIKSGGGWGYRGDLAAMLVELGDMTDGEAAEVVSRLRAITEGV